MTHAGLIQEGVKYPGQQRQSITCRHRTWFGFGSFRMIYIFSQTHTHVDAVPRLHERQSTSKVPSTFFGFTNSDRNKNRVLPPRKTPPSSSLLLPDDALCPAPQSAHTGVVCANVAKGRLAVLVKMGGRWRYLCAGVSHSPSRYIFIISG